MASTTSSRSVSKRENDARGVARGLPSQMVQGPALVELVLVPSGQRWSPLEMNQECSRT